MANYPDWVLKHKKKGTYINKVGDKYYLYAAHSERIKGTNKVRRVSDGYLGRITQEDGLIPSRSKDVLSPASFELGMSYVILQSTQDILLGLQHSFSKNGTYIYVCSVLNVIYQCYSHELYQHSYLHLAFANLTIPHHFPKNIQTAITRGTRMIQDKLHSKFGDDFPLVKVYLQQIHLVCIHNKYYCLGLTPTVLKLSVTYHLSWEDTLWQR
ncbi:MAG: hypothetical protein R3Y58_14185 [Eubacteriales bacterium]